MSDKNKVGGRSQDNLDDEYENDFDIYDQNEFGEEQPFTAEEQE